MGKCVVHGNLHDRFYFILFLVQIGLKEIVNRVQFWGHVRVTISDVGGIRLKIAFLQKHIQRKFFGGGTTNLLKTNVLFNKSVITSRALYYCTRYLKIGVQKTQSIAQL